MGFGNIGPRCYLHVQQHGTSCSGKDKHRWAFAGYLVQLFFIRKLSGQQQFQADDFQISQLKAMQNAGRNCTTTLLTINIPSMTDSKTGNIYYF